MGTWGNYNFDIIISFERRKVHKKQTYTKTEAYKLYSIEYSEYF